MLAILLMLTATAQAACPQASFEFQGQPACVSLQFEDGKTTVTNACAQGILVDQSVVLRPEEAFVPAGGTSEIRDLNTFTLGMAGKIYEVVALVEVEEVACGDTGSPAADPRPPQTSRP